MIFLNTQIVHCLIFWLELIIAYDYNPKFPGESALDEEITGRVEWILERQINKGKRSPFNLSPLGIDFNYYKILNEDKEVINHEEEMTNSLHKYKLTDNILKLGVNENWGKFPNVGNIKVNIAPLSTVRMMSPSSHFLESTLKMFPVLPKGTSEAG